MRYLLLKKHFVCISNWVLLEALGFKCCCMPSLRECQGCKWGPPCTQNLKKAWKMLFLCILLLKNMFGVVGNISPQQIKFPPVCPPKMFATPLDCLLSGGKNGVKIKRMNLGNTYMRCTMTFHDEIDIKLLETQPILLPRTLLFV